MRGGEHGPSLPGPDLLDADSLVDRLGLAARARVRHLGDSRFGRPIGLISVGDGPDSALIVGAPHPNEPTGCLTILRMLARFADAPQELDAGGWQWHFIPAIDIDGIALNAPWFSASPNLDDYVAHFYRPPFRLQPEYSFPISLPDYSFLAETPESACWRTALEMTKPNLQCALHGADTGGSFFILSEDSPGLAQRLTALPASFGITLNEIGEPFTSMTRFRPGVFAFPAIEEFPPGTLWNAGDSSAGFARRQYGTFSMTCEVPLWRDTREGDHRPSGRSMGQVVDEWIHHVREDNALLSAALPALRPRAHTFEAQMLIESLTDAHSGAEGMIAALEAARPRRGDDRPLLISDLVWMEPGTPSLRTPAMLRRVALLTGERRAEAAAGAALAQRMAAHRRSTDLSAVSLATATELQMTAIDTAARFLQTRDP